MIEEHIEQRTPEWYAMRKGVITASQAHRLLTPAKQATYARDLLAERLSEAVEDGYTSPAMQWGVDTEPAAKVAYELATGREVRDAGFVWLDDRKAVGCSPDGWVGDGLIEIKCPNTSTHLGYCLDMKPPPEYMAQMQFQMLCTNREWCDWVSYDPRLTVSDLLIIRIERDPVMFEKLLDGAAKVLATIDDNLKKLTGENA